MSTIATIDQQSEIQPFARSKEGGEVLVRVANVRKKFCRSLKKSLWYGVKDIAHELNPFARQASGADPLQVPELREDEFWAVNDVSFELRRGECLGLIGHNGAGKTTLLKMLNGLIKPDAGQIEMRGRVGALIALGAGFNPILTGRENIYVNGSVLGLTKEEIDAKMESIIEFSEIRDFIDSPVQTYSSGMAVRLGFAIAAKTEPDVLLLDEVLAVGDVGFQAKCFNTIAAFREQGVAFILVSHNMHQISRYADKILYMQKGATKHCGDRDEGIRQFLEDMQQPGTGTESTLTDWSRPYGTGRLVFKAARFRNRGGEIVESIQAGDPVSLEIDYECPAELDHPPVLDLIVRDCDGMVYQGTNEGCGQPFRRLSHSGRLSIAFDIMPVNGDYIEFFFAALDAKTSEVMDWKRHVRLPIRRQAHFHGKLVLPVTWSQHRFEKME